MNTANSYKLAMIELVLLAISISLATIAYFFHFSTTSLIIVMPMLIASIMSFIGSYYSLKSLPEPNNKKKIIAFVVNFCFASLFIFITISNLIDIIRRFNI